MPSIMMRLQGRQEGLFVWLSIWLCVGSSSNQTYSIGRKMISRLLFDRDLCSTPFPLVSAWREPSSFDPNLQTAMLSYPLSWSSSPTARHSLSLSAIAGPPPVAALSACPNARTEYLCFLKSGIIGSLTLISLRRWWWYRSLCALMRQLMILLPILKLIEVIVINS